MADRKLKTRTRQQIGKYMKDNFEKTEFRILTLNKECRIKPKREKSDYLNKLFIEAKQLFKKYLSKTCFSFCTS